MVIDLKTLLVQLREERDALDTAIFNLEFSQREDAKFTGDLDPGDTSPQSS